MPITLTMTATDEMDDASLKQRAHDVQLPFRDIGEDGIEVDCADDATADFWVQRFTEYGVDVVRTGAPEQEPIERETADGMVLAEVANPT